MVNFIIYIAAMGVLFLLDRAYMIGTDRMIDNFVQGMETD